MIMIIILCTNQNHILKNHICFMEKMIIQTIQNRYKSRTNLCNFKQQTNRNKNIFKMNIEIENTSSSTKCDMSMINTKQRIFIKQCREENEKIDKMLVDYAKREGLMDCKFSLFERLCFEEYEKGKFRCKHCGEEFTTAMVDHIPESATIHYYQNFGFKEKIDIINKIKQEKNIGTFDETEFYQLLFKLWNNNNMSIMIYNSKEFKELIGKYIKIQLKGDTWFRNNMYKYLKEENINMRKEFMSEEVVSICVSVDLWSTLKGACYYLGIFVTAVNSNFEFKTLALGCEPMTTRHTNDIVKHRVEEKIKDMIRYQSKRVVIYYVTDGGLTSCFDGNLCLCHAIQKSVEWAFDDKRLIIISEAPYELEKLIRKNNIEIWDYYCKKCEEIGVEPLLLVKKSPTRWDNLIFAYRKIRERRDPIKETIAFVSRNDHARIPIQKSLFQSRDDYVKQQLDKYLLEDDEIGFFEQILSKIENATTIFSTSSEPNVDIALNVLIDLRDTLIDILEEKENVTIERPKWYFLHRYDEKYNYVRQPKPHLVLKHYRLLFEKCELPKSKTDIILRKENYDENGNIILENNDSKNVKCNYPHYFVFVQQTKVIFEELQTETQTESNSTEKTQSHSEMEEEISTEDEEGNLFEFQPLPNFNDSSFNFYNDFFKLKNSDNNKNWLQIPILKIPQSIQSLTTVTSITEIHIPMENINNNQIVLNQQSSINPTQTIIPLDILSSMNINNNSSNINTTHEYTNTNNENDETLEEVSIGISSFEELIDILPTIKKTNEIEEINHPVPPPNEPSTIVTDNNLPEINKEEMITENQEIADKNMSRTGLFITRFLSLMDWRVNQMFHDPIFVIPSIINPRNFHQDIGRNPTGFWMLKQFMKQIETARVRLDSTPQYKNFSFDKKKLYETRKIQYFNINDYKEIVDSLKANRVILPSQFSIQQELNNLWNATTQNIDTLEFYKNNSILFPRIRIIAKVFMSIVCSEAACERMFSQAGLFVTKYRNRLSALKVEQFALNKINCGKVDPQTKQVKKFPSNK